MINFEKIKVLTFANNKFVKSSVLLKNHLDSISINNLIVKNECDLPDKFKLEHKSLLMQPRGYGYWIWKPFIILEELKKLNGDEILVYVDSSDLPEKIFFDLISELLTEKDNVFVNRGFNHGEWTKMDCFYLMGCDNDKYFNSVQLEAGLICVKNTYQNVNLISEWYENCKDARKLTDIPNQCGLQNLPRFKDHRHDQSILTNLIIKNGISSYNFNDSIIKYNYNQ